MRKIAFVLALLIGGAYLVSHTTAFAAEDAKKCEEIKDAKKKEECMKAAKQN